MGVVNRTPGGGSRQLLAPLFVNSTATDRHGRQTPRVKNHPDDSAR